MRLINKLFSASFNARDFPQYPRVTKRGFKKWNEEMFKKYHNERVYYHPNVFIRYVEKKRVESILKELGTIGEDEYILAAGCGEGHVESRIKSGRIAAVDLSREAIRQAKVKLKKRKNIDFFVADLENLQFDDRAFDKIECSEVIEHVFSPTKLMSELRRVLKDDGDLVISFPNEPLINLMKKILIKLRIFGTFFPNIPKDMTEEWHLRVLDLYRFKEIVGNDWEVTVVNGIPYNFFPIRYVIKCKKTI